MVAFNTLTLFILYSFPVNILICSLKFQLEFELFHNIVLSVVPFKVIPPPSAVVLEGDDTLPNSIFLSSTCNVVELIIVVSPLTLKLPLIVRLDEK